MAETNAVNKKKKGFLKRAKSFFIETKSELKKATWPTKQQLLHNTLIILVFIAVVAIFLSVLDLGFSELFKALTKLF